MEDAGAGDERLRARRRVPGAGWRRPGGEGRAPLGLGRIARRSLGNPRVVALVSRGKMELQKGQATRAPRRGPSRRGRWCCGNSGTGRDALASTGGVRMIRFLPTRRWEENQECDQVRSTTLSPRPARHELSGDGRADRGRIRDLFRSVVHAGHQDGTVLAARTIVNLDVGFELGVSVGHGCGAHIEWTSMTTGPRSALGIHDGSCRCAMASHPSESSPAPSLTISAPCPRASGQRTGHRQHGPGRS